jgi:uncharacterized protein (DUF3820 family)
MTTMPFGRYGGTPLQDVPKQYLRWLLRQGNIRPDLRIAIKRQLGIAVAPLPAVFDFKAAAAGERQPA